MRAYVMLAVGFLVLVLNPQQAAAKQVPGKLDTHTGMAQKDQTLKKNQEILDNIRRQRAEEQKFIADYVRLPPQERIRIWKSTTKWKNRNQIIVRMPQQMADALIARGLDTVPYLADIIRDRKENFIHRLQALNILCAMDRFVPAEESALPEVAKTYINSLNVRGLDNPFIIVDGRRIGKQAHEAVQWAAGQADEADLRFYARYHSGLLRQEFHQLPLETQLKLWRETIVKCNHMSPCDWKPEPRTLIGLLDELLAERAPESIPPLLELLENDSSGFVRMEVISILEIMDSHRMRLNGTEIGRRAIEAVRRNLDPKHPKRFYPIGWFQIGMRRKNELDIRRERWTSFQERLADDHLTVGLQTDLTIAVRAFAKFYAENILVTFNSFSGVLEPTQEIRRFVAYLTKADPYFPGWEYFYASPFMSGNQVLHPSFRGRVARYYEHWKRFKAEHSGNVSSMSEAKSLSEPVCSAKNLCGE